MSMTDGQTTLSWEASHSSALSSLVSFVPSLRMLAIVLNQALHVVVQYWAPDLSPAVMITTGLVGLILANGFSARVYGEIGEH